MYWIQRELEMSWPISKLMILVRVQKLKLKEEGDMGFDKVYKNVVHLINCTTCLCQMFLDLTMLRGYIKC